MSRKASVWWVEKEQCWRSTAFGEVSPKTGRKLGGRNREIGPPKGRDANTNRAAAELWVAAKIDEEARSIRYESEPTFGRLAGQYIAWCRAKGLAERTIRGYEERHRAFAGFVHEGVAYEDRLARDFRPADLRRIVKRLRAKGFASTWVRDVAAAARAVFRWAARPIDDRVPERILTADPFEGVEGIRVEAPPKRYAGAFARREFFDYALCRVCAIPARRLDWRWDRLAVALWRFVESTGARPDEACRLEWSHIDWEANVATLRGKTTSATGKKRRVPIPEGTAKMLKAIERLPERHERFVFTHEVRDKAIPGTGNPTLAGVPWTANAIAHKFSDWRDSAVEMGLAIDRESVSKLTLYQLRRDLGADILRETGSYADSAEVLGHSAAMSERHYASFAETHAVSLVDKIATKRKGPAA
jgi:integrase